MEYREPLVLGVNYDLSSEFVSKVNSEKDCKIINVVELSTCKILQYIIDCPKEKENRIVDYAFMTFIKNPVWQKYYHNSEAYKAVAEKYIAERMSKDHEC